MCDTRPAIKYLVACPIPEPWLGRLIEVKASFRPAGWRDTMHPHITVLAPDRPRLPPEQASAAFTAAQVEASPFTVRFATVGTFSRRHSATLILLPDSKSQLTQLFESTLHAAAGWQDTLASLKRPYEPHITLANQVHSGSAEQVRARLLELKLEPEFICNSITLYAKQAHWPRWQLLAEHRL